MAARPRRGEAPAPDTDAARPVAGRPPPGGPADDRETRPIVATRLRTAGTGRNPSARPGVAVAARPGPVRLGGRAALQDGPGLAVDRLANRPRPRPFDVVPRLAVGPDTTGVALALSGMKGRAAPPLGHPAPRPAPALVTAPDPVAAPAGPAAPLGRVEPPRKEGHLGPVGQKHAGLAPVVRPSPPRRAVARVDETGRVHLDTRPTGALVREDGLAVRVGRVAGRPSPDDRAPRHVGRVATPSPRP